jgi:hypothetical protein
VKKTRKFRGPPMKYSAIVLSFGEPVLRTLTADAPEPVRKHAMILITAAWNSLVVDEAWGTSAHLDELRTSLARLGQPGATIFGAAVDEMVMRRRELFADQHWVIGKWAFVGRGDDLRVRVEAHEVPPRPADWR